MISIMFGSARTQNTEKYDRTKKIHGKIIIFRKLREI